MRHAVLLTAAILAAVSASARSIGSRVTGLTLSPSGHVLLVGNSSASGLIIDLDRIEDSFRTTWTSGLPVKRGYGPVHGIRYHDDDLLLMLVDNDGRRGSVSTLHVVVPDVWETIDTSVQKALAADFIDAQRVIVLKDDSVLIWNFLNAEAEGTLPMRGGTAMAYDKQRVAWIGRDDGMIVRWKLGAKSPHVVASADGPIQSIFLSRSTLVSVTQSEITSWNIEAGGTLTRCNAWKRDDDTAGPVSGVDGAIYLLQRKGARVDLRQLGGPRAFRIYIPSDAGLDVLMLVDAARGRLFSGNAIDRASYGSAEAILYDLISGLPVVQIGVDFSYTGMGNAHCRPGDGARIPAELLAAIANDVTSAELVPVIETTLRRLSAKRELDRREIAGLLAQLVPPLREPLELIANYDPKLFLRFADGHASDEERSTVDHLLCRLDTVRTMKPETSLGMILSEELDAMEEELRMTRCAWPQEESREWCIALLETIVRKEPDNYRAARLLIDRYYATDRIADARRAFDAFNARFSFDAPGCDDDFLFRIARALASAEDR